MKTSQLLLFILLHTVYSNLNAQTLYVDSAIATSGNGTSWTKAYKTVHEALNVAWQDPKIARINVAKGTYYPNNKPYNMGSNKKGTEITTSDNKDKTFHIRAGLEVYGGFNPLNGTRNPNINTTALCGLLGGTDTSYHVVLMDYHAYWGDYSDTAIIDGFKITLSSAKGFGNPTITVNGNNIQLAGGGGIYITNGKNKINGNDLINNRSILCGGAIRADGGNNTFTNNILRNNIAGCGAGMRNNGDTSYIFNNVIIDNTNTASIGNSSGGGISVTGGRTNISHNIILRNTASMGGGLNITSAFPCKIFNNIISFNKAVDGGAIWMDGNSNSTFNNTFIGNYASNRGGAIISLWGNHKFFNNIFWGNKLGTSTKVKGADFYTKNKFPVIFKNNLMQMDSNSYSYSDTGYYDLGRYATNNIFNKNPLFNDSSNLTGKDGIYKTNDDGFQLNPKSILINSGNDSIINIGTTTDIIGIQRKRLGGVDIGAYEYAISKAHDTLLYLNPAGSASVNAKSLDNGSGKYEFLDTMFLNRYQFSCSDLGNNIIKFIVKNKQGLLDSVNVNIQIKDSIKPTVITKNTTIYLDSNGKSLVNISQVNNVSYDNCTIKLFSLNKTTFDSTKLGNNTVILTATDSSNNIGKASAIITVLDTIKPIVKTKKATLYLDANGHAALKTSDINEGSYDNSRIISASIYPRTFDCSKKGLNPVTLSITDISTNKSSSTTTVEVLDTIKPTIATKNIQLYLDTNGQASISIIQIDNGTLDNCSIKLLSINKTTFNCNHLGANSVILTAIDSSNNIDSGTAMVTVIDTFTKAPTGLINQKFCNSATIGELIINGSNIKWYDNKIAGNLLSPSNILLDGTNYFATQTNNGCESDSMLKVEVTINKPNAPKGDSIQSFCKPVATKDIKASGTNVKWYDSINLISPSNKLKNGSTYFATQTIDGCESLSRLSVKINYYLINDSITKSGTTLSAMETGATYQWINCDSAYKAISGETESNYIPTKKGNYAVAITKNGCMDTSECVNFISTKIYEISLSDIEILPNPSQGLFYLTGLEQNTNLTITNSIGIIILKLHVNGDSLIDISNQKSGVYILTISSENGKSVRKLIKE